MSYNIDMWKTKELEGLVIPIASLFKHEREDWHPQRVNNDDGTVDFLFDSIEIKGRLALNKFVVDSICVEGEGSGTFLKWILEPALRDSTGRLVASCVWEGGQTINRLTVIDGDVSWEDIDI